MQRNTRTCRTSEAEFLSCYAARSITENAAAAYLRICPERVDLSCNRALAQISAKDCQGLPMFNWRKHQHDPDVGNKVAIRRQLCVVAACAISVHKTMQDRVIKNSSAKNYATLGKLGHCYFMQPFLLGVYWAEFPRRWTRGGDSSNQVVDATLFRTLPGLKMPDRSAMRPRKATKRKIPKRLVALRLPNSSK